MFAFWRYVEKLEGRSIYSRFELENFLAEPWQRNLKLEKFLGSVAYEKFKSEELKLIRLELGRWRKPDMSDTKLKSSNLQKVS